MAVDKRLSLDPELSLGLLTQEHKQHQIEKNGGSGRQGWTSAVVADLSAAVVAGFIVITNCLSYAALMSMAPVFRGLFPILAEQTLWSIVLSSIAMLPMTHYITIANVDPLTAQFITQAAQEVESAMPEASPEVRAMNAFLLVPLFTVTFGFLMFVIGYLRGGIMLKFIPYNVVSGLMGGFGMILAWTALNLAMASSVSNVFESLLLALDGSDAGREATGVCLIRLALLLATTVALEKCNGIPVGKPLILLGTGVIFSVVKHLFPESSIIQYEGWQMQIGSDGVDPLAPWKYAMEAFAVADPQAIFSFGVMRELVTFNVFIIIDWCLHLPPMDKLLRLRKGLKSVDRDVEIKVMGLMSLINSLVGVTGPSCPALFIPLAVKFGGEYWDTCGTVMIGLMIVTSVWSKVVLIPQFAFAAVIFSGGLGLVHEWVVESRQRISRREWLLLAFTSVAIWYDAMFGLILGFITSLIFFVVEYAGVTGVHKMGTLLDYRSNWDRTTAEMAVLEEEGTKVVVYWLQGYLFFGSVSRIQDEVRKVVKDGARTVIIDFAYVPAVDASGVYGIVDLASELEEDGIPVILTGLVRRLKLAIRNAERRMADLDENDGPGIRTAVDLDYALSHVEDKIIKRRKVPPPLPLPRDAGQVWERMLGHAFPELAIVSSIQDLPQGQLLFEDGDPAQFLYIVISGHVSVEWWLPEKNSIRPPRLSHMNQEKGDQFVFEYRPERRVTRPGAVIAALECGHALAGVPAMYHGTARALSDSAVLSVRHEALRALPPNQHFHFWFTGVVAAQAGPCVTGDSNGHARQISHL
mmetsp:Transcript_62180/g.148339  ORF Transcript_62180/g.148339 Transcript_62180/m.148339 type:complete len:808 (-) Transcript_62180:85-2508(-)